jgi:hypothetical protein
MSSVQNFNFNISELFSYISLNKRENFMILYWHAILYLFTSKSICLIQHKPIKIKSIVNLPYKKFRTDFPRFNQNHSYRQN